MSSLQITSTSGAVSTILGKLQKQVSDLSTPLLAAGVVVRDRAVLNIKTQGGDTPWIPNKRGGHTGILSGRMWQSIAITEASSSLVKIGTNVVSDKGAPYPLYFQQGTGIFAGRSAWTIAPVRKRALAFAIGPNAYVVKKVVVPGQPPRPFLYIDAKLAAKITDVFKSYLQEAISG